MARGAFLQNDSSHFVVFLGKAKISNAREKWVADSATSYHHHEKSAIEPISNSPTVSPTDAIKKKKLDLSRFEKRKRLLDENHSA